MKKMKTITIPTLETAVPESKVLFEQMIKHLGKVPNLYAVMGHSPIALKAFLDFESTLTKGVFNGKEREAISLIVSEVNHCEYCLAAHSLVAAKHGFSNDEILAIRKGEASNPKLKAVISLAKSIASNKGKADQHFLDEFFESGYDEKALIELISLISIRTFTNFVFANTKVAIDFPLAPALS
ncbi:putative peroxidase-related enzyme [Pedobacter sp. UYP30]|uniref:carboxymuconolactone decarboxylase family protein n=1 Tax=Pedobacter sp. UYP30 TaxID=1756400 RepID=UPI003393C1B6